jgi:hypothetical protein
VWSVKKSEKEAIEAIRQFRKTNTPQVILVPFKGCFLAIKLVCFEGSCYFYVASPKVLSYDAPNYEEIAKFLCDLHFVFRACPLPGYMWV